MSSSSIATHKIFSRTTSIMANTFSNVEPRIVKIRRVQVTHAKCVNNKGSGPAYKLVTGTPVPAVLQTCYQARYKHNLYQQVFSELDTVRSGEERQYVWMNLDIDTVDAGFLTGLTLFHFQDVARSIRRLKVEIDWISCACGARAALHACFVNLQELEITVSDETFLDRQSTTREQLCSGYMPRSLKKLVVHTTADGLTSQWDESTVQRRSLREDMGPSMLGFAPPAFTSLLLPSHSLQARDPRATRRSTNTASQDSESTTESATHHDVLGLAWAVSGSTFLTSVGIIFCDRRDSSFFPSLSLPTLATFATVTDPRLADTRPLEDIIPSRAVDCHTTPLPRPVQRDETLPPVRIGSKLLLSDPFVWPFLLLVQSATAASKMAATSFHRFMYLPFELRALVWELTAEPRTVDVGLLIKETTRTYYQAHNERVQESNVSSFTPIPAIVQVCREARQLGVYRQLFSELEDIRDGGERRYVWLNLELDIVDIGEACLEDFIPVAASIKRLKFKGDTVSTDDAIFLEQCVNLKELHIVSSEDALCNLYWVFKRSPPHCGLENIFMVDSQLGLVPLITKFASKTERLVSRLEDLERRLENARRELAPSDEEEEPFDEEEEPFDEEEEPFDEEEEPLPLP
ncbi:hypothetical protein NEUTE1DRAFT_109305 [Neurospora tetrasperma FGSC 2508]|uniref:2EXR domain-containing protein n=1 Tax=Neurospora tetrasperma (strain FGSC 2508 / ATCC MYA-4615 / P0657) TaxID=510951 RepID=F8MIN7_NEUT8|nr:uncharacterized protein NEUTE1DRAFT_109305 [Neurospora tetrasperma FGSC 2508]EGO59838.1 hypothetical protein NEUTE1DRAFT_109305 [Neurospora tetrasperma FGSC 2508]EGZ73987.1 hypothetical protein NEUTE2DRAFT_138234 [Neurospora tetrasperma FGSC 2509]